MSHPADAPAAIVATSVKANTLADGTLRLTFSVEPKEAVEAFTLFGQPGVAAALAKLTQEASVAQLRKGTTKGEYGTAWQLVYKAGTLYAPELLRLLGLPERPQNGQGRDTYELVKQALYETFEVQSLTELDPLRFREHLRAAGLERILPRDF